MADAIKDSANSLADSVDADVAYRIARCLQHRYERITAVISGQCKSAGTLLAIGAHELAFSDHGELGPLDVQLRKADDMWAATSGLTVRNVCDALGQLSRIPSDGLNDPVYFLSDQPQSEPAKQAQANDAQKADRTNTAGQEPGAARAAEPAAPAVTANQAPGAEVLQFPAIAPAAPAG